MLKKINDKFRLIILILFVITSLSSVFLFEYSDGDNFMMPDTVLSDNISNSSVKKVLFKNRKEEGPDILNLKSDDFTPPTISFVQNNINIQKGECINIYDNISSVVDDVDGILEINDGNLFGYIVTTDFNCNIAGSYKVNVKAKDRVGNVSNAYFTINVSDISDKIVKLAYSLVGRPYVYGGTTVNGFDCSGFVQYLYRQNGYSIGRSVKNQINNGYEVSYSDIRPGDILIWGYDRSSVTHSAIYVGDGIMIHAANPSQGVIVSNVNSWDRGTNVSVVSVRRII